MQLAAKRKETCQKGTMITEVTIHLADTLIRNHLIVVQVDNECDGTVRRWLWDLVAVDGILQHRLKIGIHQCVGNIGYDDGVHKIAGSPNPILRKHIHVAAAQEIADELVKLRDPVLVRGPGPVSQVNGIHLLLDAAAAASPMDHGACVRRGRHK